MNKRTLVLPLVLSVVGAAALAGPAAAADTGDTTMALDVTAGSLDITVPAAVDLGDAAASTGAVELEALLGEVAVTDGRGSADIGWVVTAVADAVTGPTTLPAGAVVYTAGVAVVVGTASVSGTDSTDLTISGPVQEATGVSGANSATWDPTVTVTLPAGSLAGAYTTTITHSVA